MISLVMIVCAWQDEASSKHLLWFFLRYGVAGGGCSAASGVVGCLLVCSKEEWVLIKFWGHFDVAQG